MPHDVPSEIASLSRALEEHARTEARRCVDVLASQLHAADGGVTDADAQRLMQGLLDRRWFDSARALGRALQARGNASRRLLRQYAQALIEERELEQALALLESLLKRTDLTAKDRSEASGLVGRIFKQVDVERRRLDVQRDRSPLELALRTYLEAYDRDRESNAWHGINAVALLALARRLGRSEQALGDPQVLARQILDQFDANADRTVWDDASCAEALVALGDFDGAAQCLRTYAWHPEITAFHLGSTLRQFTEIWELDAAGGDERGRELVTLLRARLLELENGRVVLSPEERRVALSRTDARLEKVFEGGRFISYERYKRGLQRCEPVARIGTEVSRGEGTGFLMRGTDLSPTFGDGVVLVTNHHVLDPEGARGLHPGEAMVCFHALEGVAADDVFRIKQVLWTSPPEELDCTVATLDRVVPLLSPYPLAPMLPNRNGDALVYVIGHPAGGALSFALQDSRFLDHDDRLLHYRTATEGGNSGSPVFNSDWSLVGLHHAGGDAMRKLRGQPGTYQANEGVSILAIRAAIPH